MPFSLAPFSSRTIDGDFHCSIEAHIASKDKFRVVGYNIPGPYPLRNGACSSEMAAVVDQYVEERATTILRDHGIEEASRSLQRRWRPPEEGMHSYLIYTTSTSTDIANWKNAATEINHLFLVAGVAQEDIEVEIVNTSLSIYRTSSALPDDPTMNNALGNAESKVVDFLQSNAPSQWTSVAVHMRGNKFRPSEPKRPTILLFFRGGSVTNFETLEKQLAEELKSEPIPLIFEFLSGQISLC